MGKHRQDILGVDAETNSQAACMSFDKQNSTVDSAIVAYKASEGAQQCPGKEGRHHDQAVLSR